MKMTGFMMAAGMAVVMAGGWTGCQSVPAEENNSPVGRWAFDRPCGWLGVEQKPDGSYAASMLWGGGSPVAMTHVAVQGNRIEAWRPNGTAKDPKKQTYFLFEGVVTNGVLTGGTGKLDANGVKQGALAPTTAKRIPDLPAAPDLSRVRYGTEVDLLAQGLDGWETMNPRSYFGWSFKDGVLSNRIRRDEKGKPKGANANLKTKRADFMDFKISYDVRVLPHCNSGVYLRGIYELQVLDSYGRTVDCHNMAAPYGRITPRVSAEKPAGEWQHVDAILCDRHVTVVLNGVNIVDNKPLVGVTGGSLTSNEFVPGPMYLQGDHSDADFKNMKLTPIIK